MLESITSHKSHSAHVVRFRWPIEKTNETEVTVMVPRGIGPPVLNTEFVKMHQLSDREIDASEDAVIREIMILK